MATAQPVFHTDEESTEREMDHVDPSQDLVSFNDVAKTYTVGDDIPVTYNLGRECRPSSRDWVGLYPRQWTSTKDYVTYEWSPKFPKDDKRPYLRSILFKSSDLKVTPSEETRYQLLYLTKHSQIVGVSSDFFFLPSSYRPGQRESFTLLTEPSLKASSHGFEVIETRSNSSSEHLGSDWSDVCFDDLFSEPNNTSDPVDSFINLDLLYDVSSIPLKHSASSAYHLDWLFEEDQKKEEVENNAETKIYSEILFAPRQEVKNNIDTFKILNETCDGQWDDMFLEAVEEAANRAVSQGTAERSVVVYQPRHVIPYHTTDILPYTPPGPLVLYEPPRFMIPYNSAEMEKTKEEKKNEEEPLLTPIHTRRFSPTNQQIQDLLSGIGPMTLTISQPEQTSTHPDWKIVPFTPKGVNRTRLSRSDLSKKALKRKTKKARCLKCAKKRVIIKRNKKVRASGELLVAGLQRSLEQSDQELALKAAVLEDLGKQVKDITHDNTQLKAINNDLSKKLAERQNEGVKRGQDQQRWLEQSLQASQQENQDLKNKCGALRDKLDQLKEAHVENEKNRQLEINRRTARHLSTIASQETTINSLSRECSRLLEQIQEGRRRREEMERLHKETCRKSEALSIRITKLQEKIDAEPTREMLSERLSSERQKREEVIHRSDEERRAMQEQIVCLQTALDASQLLSEQYKARVEQSYGTAPGGPQPLDLSMPKTAVKKTKRTYKTSTSQTSGVETKSKTAQTVPMLDNPVTSRITSMNCDPAVIKVGAISRFSRHNPLPTTNPEDPLVTETPEQVAAWTPVSHSSFFASGMEFFSGISKTLTETFADEFLPASSIAEQQNLSSAWEGSSTAHEHPPTSPEEETQEPKTKSWSDWVEEEEEESMAAADQWVPDFMASWRPKSGKKANQAPGRGVRFDDRDQRQPGQSKSRGQRKCTNRSSPGYKGYGRRNIRRD